MQEQEIRELSEAIDRVNIPVDGAALAGCFKLLDKLNAKITCAVGDYDRSEQWRDTGAKSMTGWLRNRCRRSGREAASYTRTARRLCELPVLAGAYRDGSLSTAQVHAVVGNLNNETTPLFAETEQELVPTLARMSVSGVSTAMQQWAQAAADSLHDPTDPEPRRPQRRLHLSNTLNGRRELSASLDPEAGELAEAALRLAETPDVEGEPARTPAERRADALVAIFRFFLDNQQTRRGGRHRPHSTCSSTTTTSSGAPVRGGSPTGQCWTGPRCRGWPAMPGSTGSSPKAVPASSITARPLAPCPPTSTTPSSPATSTAGSLTVTVPQSSAKPTTSNTGLITGRRSSRTWSSNVGDTTTFFTCPAGPVSSNPTEALW